MMLRFMKRVSRKAGLPPGSLIHVGEKKVEKTRIRLIRYDEMSLDEKELESIEEAFPYKDKQDVTWINIDGLHEVEVIEEIGKHFGLHPLVLEDILHTGQRPKIDDYEAYAFITSRMLSYDEQEGQVHTEQFSLVFGPHYVLSFQERPGDVFEPVRDRLRKGKGRIRRSGVDYLVYALIDAIVDHYFLVLERVAEEIEILEEDLLSDPSPQILQKIHALKRELIFMRKSVWPLREMIVSMERGESNLIQEKTIPFLRDVFDHTIQVVETIETFRDMVSGMLDIYLSSISNRMNEVMKVLTIIATLFIPLTFIAGIYGMNFEYMPELKWRWGYFFVWGIMIALALVMFIYIKRKRWL
jgi:magnesium transporter